MEVNTGIRFYGEILMSKLTGFMRKKGTARNLVASLALATCPRKSTAPLDRFWSVIELAGCH